MSEETRIVEEQENIDAVAQSAELSVGADVAVPEQPEAGAPVHVQAEPEVEAVAEAETVAPIAEASSNQTEADDDEEGDDQSAEYRSEDGKQVVYLSVGQEVTGTIKRTTEFVAFVDIGAGRDGLIHISELAVGRVNKVGDVVKDGQQVTAWIKKLDRKRNRISLTLIAPGTRTLKDLKEGEIVPGTVSKIMPYGAFINIGVGTDALLHIREMSNGYVNKPEDVVKVGEALEARIISVDRRRRRIDLSLKGLRDEPESEVPVQSLNEPESAESVEDPYADVEVLSPMELAFKRAMEAEGIEVNVKKGGKDNKRGKKRNRSIQDEIISRTLSMRD